MRTLNTELISAFRHSAPYITMHRGQTFVFLLSAETIADRHIDSVISDIAILQSLGIKLVIVFGCKNQIDNALADAKVKTRFYKRIRIADTRSFSIIKRVCGDIQYNITSKLSMGLGNTPMQGLRLSVVTGNFVTAKPVGVIDGIDFCHSGTIRRVDAEGINFQLDRGNVVVISPICVSVTGESFSLNSEDLASRVAIDLKANKFITFCPFQGIIDDEGHVVPELFPDQAEEYLSKLDEDDVSSTARYLRAAIASCRGGVPRSHLVSHADDGALLQELFTRDGIGTQIVKDSAEQVRQARISDIGSLMELIKPMEDAGILIHRPRELLELQIDHYVIIERDGMVIGSAALYPYMEEKCGELACVAIHPNYRSGGRSDLLIETIEQKARKMGLKKIFVLTTSTAHFFLEKGFVPGTVDDLPKKKRDNYNYQRKSKIFFKNLDDKPL